MKKNFPQFNLIGHLRGKGDYGTIYTSVYARKRERDSLFEGLIFTKEMDKDDSGRYCTLDLHGVLDKTTEFNLDNSEYYSHIAWLKMEKTREDEVIGQYLLGVSNEEPDLNNLKEDIEQFLIPQFDIWAKKLKKC